MQKTNYIGSTFCMFKSKYCNLDKLQYKMLKIFWHHRMEEYRNYLVFFAYNNNRHSASGFTRYDFKAGFWGVMGQPCLGIIPVR